MGGKGRKRREKNYKAAHGGYTTLPPPPKASQLDALPIKLRQIISFSQNKNGTSSFSKDKKIDDGNAQNKDTKEQLKATQHSDGQLIEGSENDNKKKKRKRKEIKDLRFALEDDKTSSQLKKRERKKKYLESKKKKHKKVDEEESFNFPGKEKIKFGDVVQAPPKLSIPKAFKNAQDASQERLRLRAIEEYRSRKKWASRPGSHQPPPVAASDS